jgi:hypothetical protein
MWLFASLDMETTYPKESEDLDHTSEIIYEALVKRKALGIEQLTEVS